MLIIDGGFKSVGVSLAFRFARGLEEDGRMEAASGDYISNSKFKVRIFANFFRDLWGGADDGWGKQIA